MSNRLIERKKYLDTSNKTNKPLVFIPHLKYLGRIYSDFKVILNVNLNSKNHIYEHVIVNGD